MRSPLRPVRDGRAISRSVFPAPNDYRAHLGAIICRVLLVSRPRSQYMIQSPAHVPTRLASCPQSEQFIS